ncbi:MAG: riboflavin synthase [Candidatus Paceibacterales bacterium]
MFSGIVEEKGTLKNIERRKNLIVLGISAGKVSSDTKTGDSIAIDGTCLTVTKKNGCTLFFDVMKETIEKTTLKYLKPGDKINLERSLKVDSRIGGHFVFGHVDCEGIIKKKITLRNYVRYDIAINRKLMRYIVSKGSISVDGISLTVGEVKGNVFSVYIIPHTLQVTTLKNKKETDKVNIETDVLAKYLLKQK